MGLYENMEIVLRDAVKEGRMTQEEADAALAELNADGADKSRQAGLEGLN